MALYNYTDRESLTLHNQVIDKMNMIFTIIYAVEATLKIIALGFWGKHSYLKETWNIIDFIVVITG
jgi:Ion transport protein